jgi:hypothetical protein
MGVSPTSEMIRLEPMLFRVMAQLPVLNGWAEITRRPQDLQHHGRGLEQSCPPFHFTAKQI